MSRKTFNPSDWLAPATPSPDVQGSGASGQAPPSAIAQEIEVVVRRVEAAAIDIAPVYVEWRDLGFALADALGEGGRECYHRLSRFHPGYTAAGTDRQYTACLHAHGHGITVRTLFHLAGRAVTDARSVPAPSPASHPASSDGISPDILKTSKTSTEGSEVFEDFGPATSGPMPSFHERVRDGLPGLLRQITAHAHSPEDADLLLLGSLTVFSACLPNIHGIYDGREVFPNLFLFVTAQASAGKGRLWLCRHLVEPIHRQLREQYAAEMEAYRRKMSEYVTNKKNPDAEPPAEPPLKTLFIPANSSATAVYQTLNDNDGAGLIFETEGDTLANTFKSDFGNFSDGFRKAFHHEKISYNRRKDKEFVELARPRLSALLSGTPRQVMSLIPDAENGLFSRFIFYCMNVRLVWNDVFAVRDGTLDSCFEGMGRQFSALYGALVSHPPIRFELTSAQQAEFQAFFSQVQDEYTSVFGLDILASVRRLGLIAFRLAMILSAVRLLDRRSIPAALVCGDGDFTIVRIMVEVLLKHTAKVFQQLPADRPEAAQGGRNQLKRHYYCSLPPEFDKQAAVMAAQRLQIPAKTAERYLKQWCLSGRLNHTSHGHYAKP